MQEKFDENVATMPKFNALMNDIASLDENDREKVSIFIQGIMAMREMRDKKQATA